MSAPTDLQTRFEYLYSRLRPWHKLCRWYGLAAIVSMMFIGMMIAVHTSSQHAYPQPMLDICITVLVVSALLHFYTTRVLWRIAKIKIDLLYSRLSSSEIETVYIWFNPIGSPEIEFRYYRTAYKYDCSTKMFARGHSDAMRVGEWYDWEPTFQEAIVSKH